MFVIYIHLGGFQPVSIKVDFFGPKYLLYKTHIGAYHKINASITEVERWSKKNGYDCQTTFGQYLSDPKTTQTEYLKSYAGCVIHHIPSQIPPTYQAKQLPKMRSVIAYFNGSPAIGPWKVYPQVKKFIKNKGLTSKNYLVEFYNLKNKTLTSIYVFPLLSPSN